MNKKQMQKLIDENRIFNVDQELQYYMIFAKDKMVSLLQGRTLNTIKRYNAKSHNYNKFVALEGEACNRHFFDDEGKCFIVKWIPKIYKPEIAKYKSHYEVAYILVKR